jgi:hypothetical protein
MTGEYKHVGNHAEDLADGRMLAPGETVKLNDKQLAEPHNQRLITEGILLDLGPKREKGGTE